LLSLLKEERALLAQEPQEAAALVPQQGKPQEDRLTVAAWSTVARVLLNLDETITRE
jgi:hypothetical protein